jgi:hypothetical protein
MNKRISLEEDRRVCLKDILKVKAGGGYALPGLQNPLF